MKATVKIFFLNAKKVVKINNPTQKFKLWTRILSGSKKLVGFAIPRYRYILNQVGICESGLGNKATGTNKPQRRFYVVVKLQQLLSSVLPSLCQKRLVGIMIFSADVQDRQPKFFYFKEHAMPYSLHRYVGQATKKNIYK